jgi:hypothetical protein
LCKEDEAGNTWLGSFMAEVAEIDKVHASISIHLLCQIGSKIITFFFAGLEDQRAAIYSNFALEEILNLQAE